MYLKEIRAKGFKSFAESTIIELTPDITGIVGPNGSGKSNVVDAVRWVLGEQSIKSLRGANNMTDVIFSGSKTRKPSTSASVTLVFDNSDRYLPINSDTVSIKRQVYQTGESDYFLNNTACRLKDITDLVIDTGMAKESFNIIGQGAIDNIINTKADERRVMFEEAAGVLKYKKRKDKALRKLDQTNQNLDRVEDIIVELETNLEPLKEQYDKAVHYQNLKDTLYNLDIAVVAHDITDYNNQLINEKHNLDSLNDQVLKINTYSSEEETLINQHKNKLQTLNEHNRSLNSKLINDTKQLEALKAEKQLMVERTKFTKDNENMNLLLNLKEELTKNQSYLKMLEIDKQNLDNDIIKLNKEHNLVNDNKNQLTIDLNDVISQFQKTDNDQYQINQKIKRLENIINEGSNLNSSVKFVLNNAKLSGIHDIVAKLLHVEEKYTTVVNTALGGTGQFIIVNHENDAKTAINYLRINELGRATFLPISVIKPKIINEQELQKIVSDPGFVDIAINLISFNPMYYNVYASLLGNTIVAKTIEDANRLSKILNHRYKIVTLNGDLINIGGSLTGGKYKNQNGYLVDTLELNKLREMLPEKTAELNELNDLLQSKKQALNSINDQLNHINEKIIHYRHLINHKQQLIDDTNILINDLNNQLNTINAVNNNSLTSLEEELLKNYYDLDQDIKNTTNQISSNNLNIEDLTHQINELEHTIKSKNSNYNSLLNELKNCELTINKLEFKIDNSLNYLNEEYNMTYEHALNHYPLSIDYQAAKSEVNKLKREIKELGIVNIGAIDEYERINERYTFLISQKEDLLKAKTSIIEIIDDMDIVMKEAFIKTFNDINNEFNIVYQTLFGGGVAKLVLTDETDLLNTGIEINVQPPGKKLTHISLLSGGEKTLTAISLLFAILNTRSVPFSILDEVEAALDEANVIRFCQYLKQYQNKTQFLIITHKKQTMEYVNRLYGVTMKEAGISKLVSVKLSA